jgi:hypothetical protein
MTDLSLRRHPRHPRESGDPERKGNNALLCLCTGARSMLGLRVI